jgi:hypothetical protein
MHYNTLLKVRMSVILGSIISFGLLINACQKKGSDDTATPTYADLSGLYTGTSVITTATDTTMVNEEFQVTKMSDNKFGLTHVSSGQKIADLTATGNNFTGKGDFKSMNGNLNGNTITFNAVGNDGSKIQFVGNRPAGGNNTGTDITIDGIKYKLLSIDCAASSYAGNPTWEMSANYKESGGTEYAFVTLVFSDQPSNHNYDIVTVDKAQGIGVEPGEVWAFISCPSVSDAEATVGTISVSVTNGVPSANITGVSFNRSLNSGLSVSSPSVSGTVVCL